MSTNALTLHSIVGAQTTAGAAEETVNLSLDGAVAAASIAVSAGTTLYVSDLALSSVALATWKLQQANDGVTFFDIGFYSSPASSVGMQTDSPKVAYAVSGDAGTSVLFRLRVTTGGGAAAVSASLRAYTQS